jgi:hypothetical protein
MRGLVAPARGQLEFGIQTPIHGILQADAYGGYNDLYRADLQETLSHAAKPLRGGIF